ncbi:aminotransferase [Xylariomycetidae sp. FL0641]|nr:aminotransferase [Xylariomycetidae sp. FL0641]
MGSAAPDPPAKPLINLQLGWPSPRLFAREGLLQGATEVLGSAEESAAALVYGPHLGQAALRASVADWLSAVYRRPVGADGIAVTNGASGNLANALQRFTDPGHTRRVFMAEPTYFLACPIFADNGLGGRLRGVPEAAADGGLDLACLRRELEAADREEEEALLLPPDPDRPTTTRKAAPAYPKLFRYVVYCVPTFANPSGQTMPLRARERLVALAREFDALVVSDDVYDFLHWPADDAAAAEDQTTTTPPPPPRLVDVDRAMPGYGQWGNTLSNGSFSKLIGPGVRVGWADCAPALARELAEVGSSSSGGAPSHLTSTFVDKMLRAGSLQAHIATTLIPTYGSRYRALMAAVDARLLPLGVVVEAAARARPGGFFAYLRLPPDVPAARTVAAFALREHRLRIAFGHMFTVAGDAGSLARAEAPGGFARCVRLCWAWHEEDALREGVERLAEALREIRERIKRGEDVGSQLSIGIR